jgi:hypothetical protein
MFAPFSTGQEMRSREGWRLGAAAALLLLAACRTDRVESTSTSSEESGYCADLAALIDVLGGGDTIGEYNELLNSVVDESPAGHASTWSLLLTLSVEPFSYDNFNRAVDSLERLDPELDATCPRLGPMIVDDAGRVRSYATD